VIFALSNVELLSLPFAIDTIDKPVLASNAAGPPALQVIFKGFRFPEPLKRIALDVFN
jgi:hypothetical protein